MVTRTSERPPPPGDDDDAVTAAASAGATAETAAEQAALPAWKLLPTDPRTPAAAAMRTIHLRLLQIILANEDGVRQGEDIEALHDFRVFTRRSRTGIRQMRKVYPKNVAKRFGKEFAWLTGMSGPARDLDVALHDLDFHAALLTAAELDGVVELFVYLGRRRDAAYHALHEAMDEVRYKELIGGWSEFLKGRGVPEKSGPAAELPIIEVASVRIGRTLTRILDEGAAPKVDTPSARLHRLRLDCKKLRYLLEFFGSLYDPALITEAVGTLKRLQDTLGGLNDSSVQSRLIGDFLEARGDTSNTALGGAVGRITARLRGLVNVERSRLVQEFATFAGAAAVRRLHDDLVQARGNV